jgi:hypothetical protein
MNEAPDGTVGVTDETGKVTGTVSLTTAIRALHA